MPTISSLHKAAEIVGACTCHDAYANRNLTDPNCQYCLHAEDIALALDEAKAERTEEIAQHLERAAKDCGPCFGGGYPMHVLVEEAAKIRSLTQNDTPHNAE